MSYSSANPRVKSQQFRPQAADPSNPVEGMVFRSDGTPRGAGLWEYRSSAWQQVGSASSTVDTFVSLTGDDVLSSWSTGDNATFLGAGALSGTFAKDTSTPFNGTASYKYTQAANSLNDYLASPAQAVPIRFRGTQVLVKCLYTYDGLSSDISAVVYDATNAAVLTQASVMALRGGTGTVPVTFQAMVYLPTTCASLRIGFHVKALNDGKILEFDDFQVSAPETFYMNIGEGVVGEVISHAGDTAPGGFLACDGAAVSRSRYWELYNIISTDYGTGDGSTTFNVPDYRGRFLRGHMSVVTTTGSGTAGSNNATFTAHGINRTGLKVRKNSGTLTGLSASTTYYAIVIDANTLAFATTYANALAVTKIAISGANSAVIGTYEDPELASRVEHATGSTAGAVVGSRQEDQFLAHTHTTVIRINAAVSPGAGSSHPNDDGSQATGSSGGTETRAANVSINYYIRYSATGSTNIVAAPTSFSTDTASLVYASSATYTLTTLADAAVGTFITFTYAINTNTRTQTTTAPTQTTSSMNSNGILLYTRAYNAASTSTEPAVVAIQIGKNLKGVANQLYKSTSKATGGTLDADAISATVQMGMYVKSYNATTGILVLDSGYASLATITSSLFIFEDVSTQASGYIVVNASQSPTLIGVPQVIPRFATISDVKAANTAGGTATSGSFETRTLNTLVDNSNFVTSLAANQFTLPAGEYYFDASAPAYLCGSHVIQLYDTTAAATSLTGTAEYTITTDSVQTRAHLTGSVVITVSSVFELRHRVTTTRSTNGYGVAANLGVDEVYSLIKITKVK